ncbi:bacteriocin [Enterococcus sp. N249-2]
MKTFSELSKRELESIEGGAIITTIVAGITVKKVVTGVGIVGAGIGVGYLVNR